MKKIIISLLTIASTLLVSAQTWSDDILGNGLQMRYVHQPADYSGAIRSTIIRLVADSAKGGNRGVLYIHGFNDYFFQTEMAQQFVNHGYDFYAVDLRKYGRSLLPGQKPCQVRSLDEYFPDIDSALCDMKRYGVKEIVLMGHSTGGLVASYYMEKNNPDGIKALILNSPFLDWNLGKMEPFVGVVSFLGALFPNIKVPQGNSSVYSESLLKNRHGEWSYNTVWKSETSRDVDLGWVRAIDRAQEYLRKHKYAIHVPILLMYSDKSISADDWSEAASNADAVLDVNDIKHYGQMLGKTLTMVKVNNGLHDLILSKAGVRYPLYKYIFSWLGRELSTY
ncbi:MAG: alpha/beta hydrolase [Paramuribaculum sp.]|nr:alpha/beta hydrolase [Paramuribaculum sp.]